MMELSDEQRQQLDRVLLDALPTLGELQGLLADQLDIQLTLAEIVPHSSTDKGIAIEVIRYCEAQGRLGELIQATRRHNPENPELQQWLEALAPDRFKIRYQTATAQFYTEPLEGLGSALPLQLILVPGGTFTMGSPETEADRAESEGPQHLVSVAPFFIGRYPITQAQWRVVAALPQNERELTPDPSHFKGDNRPVEYVSWEDAVEFCARLATHTGRPYRLPSEAEWEYACRAGSQTPFSFGKTITTDLANYDGDSTYGDGPKGQYRGETTAVESLDVANAFGLYDMHGNVWEWCADRWHENYEAAPTDGSSWDDRDDNDNHYHLLRGGSWYYGPEVCRSASRFRSYHVSVVNHIGFRVVCSAP